MEEFIKKNFNPRPREEGDEVIDKAHIYKNDFNPRPREEGDIRFVVFPLERGISIHALVKRATSTCTALASASRISIHALVKRATTYSNIAPVDMLFQSTPS